MKKITVNENFFKDIVFNKFTYRRYLLVDKLVLIGGILVNAVSFFLYSITGNMIFQQMDFYLRIMNALLIMGIFVIYHRVNVNDLNISIELSNIDCDSFYSMNVKKVEILPLNFVFNEDLPLKEFKKIYKDGAYFIISTKKCEFIFKTQDSETYLIEEEDRELEEIKKLRLLR